MQIYLGHKLWNFTPWFSLEARCKNLTTARGAEREFDSWWNITCTKSLAVIPCHHRSIITNHFMYFSVKAISSARLLRHQLEKKNTHLHTTKKHYVRNKPREHFQDGVLLSVSKRHWNFPSICSLLVWTIRTALFNLPLASQCPPVSHHIPTCT